MLLSANSCRSYLCNVLHCNLPCIAVDRLALKLVSKAADLAAENVQYHANMGFNIVAELEVIETSTVGDHVSSINDHHNQQQQQQLQGRPSLRNSRNLQVESSKRLKSRHECLVTGNGKLEDNCSICLEEFLAGTELVRLNPCKHTYHPNCILQWMLDNRNSCPMCRGRILRV